MKKEKSKTLLAILAVYQHAKTTDKNLTFFSLLFFFGKEGGQVGAVTVIAVIFFPEAAALPVLAGIFLQQILAAVMGRLNMRF